MTPNIGDVFYRIEKDQNKSFYQDCRVCGGTKELTVNGVTFKCPMCEKEKVSLTVHSYKVVRYRVYSKTEYTRCDDWKPCETRDVKYGLYHKSGKGYYSYSSTNIKIDVNETYFNAPFWFDNPDPEPYYLDKAIYSDYNLAVKVANAFTQKQIDKVADYNKEHNTNFELPVFEPNHDKKSK